MDGNEEATIDINVSKERQTRQRSTIGFPYMDLKAAIEIADAIHSHVGTGDCTDDQLAAWTDQSAKSSMFRAQYYAARMFGLISGDGGHHRLTDAGRAIVDPDQAREAKANAFMAVPLYQRVYDKYKGGVLPPVAALERDMVGIGVSEKQKDKARQVFERSAEQAGFFENGKTKLVMPGVIAGKELLRDPSPAAPKNGNGGNGGGGGNSVDPIIQGLLARLPPTGAIWPEDERTLWLDLLKGSFKLIYKDRSPQ
ncbi:hypothetical protein [Labrys wisconsinensis]|uniref:Uncharacterized protein n=1 Tax=Labrys wisconsinensis TaxID=425677 RepID=A0ABU0J332_9HYPH|nr:hypothetical protein [Labrys wisconsinensis]MDQ0467714.1 hypothetical protein [Labrys wisconsinensis]